ncbi:cytochrome c family protein [Desulfovibrio ferrophilus]|uniref:Cytochrome c family protein n=3 Tax=Desulfovibrio ferrophilus TaxID=241368 RepID=A0A2Z6AUE3_9BACT|nr:cytochrome c family protein [Desulfovibrio ferrophilus]
MTVCLSLARAALLAVFSVALSLTLVSASVAAVDTSTPAGDNGAAPGRKLARQAVKDKQLWITSDHSKHEVLQQDFKTPEDLTKACLTCHTEAATQFHKTIHWTWLDPNLPKEEQVGKGGLVINNF